MTSLALILALIWGAVWASFLQFTALGRYMAVRRTWITVVVGVAGVMLLALLTIPFAAWLTTIELFALASLPIIVRSLANEFHDDTEVLDAYRSQTRQ
jgi:hypothetical protein